MINKGSKEIVLLLILGFFLGCNSSENSEENSNPELAAKESENPTKADYVEQASFTTFDGDTVAVSDFKGKVVMIDLWETWCKPCLASFPTMQQLQEDYPEDFVVLAVTPGFMDTQKDAQNFASEHDYDFRYLMDSNGLHKKLGVQGIPYKIFVDADGEFIKVSMGSFGPDQDYKKIEEIIENNKSMD